MAKTIGGICVQVENKIKENKMQQKIATKNKSII